MDHPKDCDNVYGYSSSEDIKKFYDDTAKNYDNFLKETNYILDEYVANEVIKHVSKNTYTVLDIGCGSGALGLSLGEKAPQLIIDGVDISTAMLGIAKSKIKSDGQSCYNYLFERDLTKPIFFAKEYYDILTSSGTFTPGHLGSEELFSLLSCLKPGGLVVVSIKKDHFSDTSFDKALNAKLDIGLISDINYVEVPIWNHKDYSDTAFIVSFIKKLQY